MPIQAVTVGRYHQRSWKKVVSGKILVGPVYGVKLYEARPRKDGRLVWRLERVVVEQGSFSTLSTCTEKAKAYAERTNHPFFPDLKHGDLFTSIPIEATEP